MTVFFIHIPKTAGTTLRSVITRQFSETETYELYPCWPHQIQEYCASDKRNSYSLVMGHYSFGLHLCCQSPFQYITMLRDPVEQIISHYNHLTSSQDPLHQGIIAENPTLTEFARHPWARHFQLQRVTGATVTEIESAPDRWLNEAKENILNHFSWVGISERFDESLLLLGFMYGWRDLSYCSLNTAKFNSAITGKQMRSVQPISNEQTHHLEESTALDMELYRFADNLLNERLKEIPDLDQRVADLRAASVAEPKPPPGWLFAYWKTREKVGKLLKRFR